MNIVPIDYRHCDGLYNSTRTAAKTTSTENEIGGGQLLHEINHPLLISSIIGNRNLVEILESSTAASPSPNSASTSTTTVAPMIIQRNSIASWDCYDTTNSTCIPDKMTTKMCRNNNNNSNYSNYHNGIIDIPTKCVSTVSTATSMNSISNSHIIDFDSVLFRRQSLLSTSSSLKHTNNTTHHESLKSLAQQQQQPSKGTPCCVLQQATEENNDDSHGYKTQQQYQLPRTSSSCNSNADSVVVADVVSIATKNKNKKKLLSVSFATNIEFQEYSIIAIDHPCNKDGLALSLDWDHTIAYTIPLDTICKERYTKY
jgi:hypothetical protein